MNIKKTTSTHLSRIATQIQHSRISHQQKIIAVIRDNSQKCIDVFVRSADNPRKIGYGFADIIEGKWILNHFQNWIYGPITDFCEELERLNEGKGHWNKSPKNAKPDTIIGKLTNWIGYRPFTAMEKIFVEDFNSDRLTAIINNLAA